ELEDDGCGQDRGERDRLPIPAMGAADAARDGGPRGHGASPGSAGPASVPRQVKVSTGAIALPWWLLVPGSPMNDRSPRSTSQVIVTPTRPPGRQSDTSVTTLGPPAHQSVPLMPAAAVSAASRWAAGALRATEAARTASRAAPSTWLL